MKPSVSKTVHVDKRPSFAGDLVTIFAGRAERTAETTAMRQTLPGKSRVGQILLNENTGQERLLGMRLSDIENAQRKTAVFLYHQKKTFMARMEHRQNTWVREHTRRAGILNSMASRKRESLSKVSGTEGFRDMKADGESTNRLASTDKGKAEPKELVDTKEKGHLDTSDILPDINLGAHKCNTSREKQTKSSKRKSMLDGHTSNPSLPSVQNTRVTDKPEGSFDGLHLPSVLITTDTEEGHQEGAPRCARSSRREDVRKTKPRKELESPHQPSLAGPSPTFISEVLPRIQIQECLGIPHHLSRKTRRRRKGWTNITNDPLVDERFLSLQHTLAPRRARHESRDMAVIFSGVVNAKKIAHGKGRQVSKVKEDF